MDWTRDVFDRLIAAESAAMNLALITKDRTIRAHHKLSIWCKPYCGIISAAVDGMKVAEAVARRSHKCRLCRVSCVLIYSFQRIAPPTHESGVA